MLIPNDNWIGGHLGNHRLLELEMKDSLAKFIMRSAFLYIYMNTYSIYTYLRMYVLFVIKLMLPSLKKKKEAYAANWAVYFSLDFGVSVLCTDWFLAELQ